MPALGRLSKRDVCIAAAVLAVLLWPLDLHESGIGYFPVGLAIIFCAGEFSLGLYCTVFENHPIRGWFLILVISSISILCLSRHLTARRK
jgi:hypothetical protein